MPRRAQRLSPSAALAALAMTLALGACAGTRYVRMSPPAPRAPHYRAAPMAVESGWRNAFLFGLLPRTIRVDAARICGTSGVAEVRTGRTAGQAFLAMLSVGVYSPSFAEVVCGRASPASSDQADGAAKQALPRPRSGLALARSEAP